MNLDKILYPEKGQQKNIFFSGKGGVGKTSMACVTAVATANQGYKTLLLTTDPASHIGSVLDCPVSDEITEIDGQQNLYAVKIDQKKATEAYKEKVLSEARNKFDPTTVMAMEEELDSPCTEEMASFQKFVDYAGGTDFDVIVVDTAPTGHTLRLLELPMDWSKQIQMKAGVSTTISSEDQAQQQRFDRVMDMMKDPRRTTFSFVMYPEKTPIAEAHRASRELETLGIKTRLAVGNLVIPEEYAVTPFFKNRRSMQLKYLEEMKTTFPEASHLEVPMYGEEIKGLKVLREIAASIYNIETTNN